MLKVWLSNDEPLGKVCISALMVPVNHSVYLVDLLEVVRNKAQLDGVGTTEGDILSPVPPSFSLIPGCHEVCTSALYCPSCP